MAGQRVLVTGAASGIGAALTKRLLHSNIDVLGLDIHAFDAPGPSGDINARFIGKSGDVAKPETWKDLTDRGLLEGIHSGVLCAGISASRSISEMSFQDWRSVLAVNLDGVFLSVQALLRNMPDGGSIVAVSSATAGKAVASTAAYGASKAGLEQLIRVAALEAADRGIRVNAVAPGGVKTPMFSDQEWFSDIAASKGEAHAWNMLAQGTPRGKLADADEVVDLIEFLLSNKAVSMTGSIVTCDGGYAIA